MAGYDIKKTLDGDVSSVVDIRVNNLYPLLNELAGEGLVQYVWIEQKNRPSKKVYELTVAGRTQSLAALARCETRQRFRSELLFVLKFAPFLTAQRVEELLANRVLEIRCDLARLEEKGARASASPSPGYRFALGLARAVLSAELDYILESREAVTGLALERTEGSRL